MFYETTAVILDGDFATLGTMLCDLQPTRQVITLEDQIELEVTARAFCAPCGLISASCYLKISTTLYKILRITPWDEYWELWLYRCERSAP